MDRELYTIRQLAEECGITKQAVYLALRSLRLNGIKIASRWYITDEELQDYRNNRYNRCRSRQPNGDLVYSEEKGRYSIRQLADLADVPLQRLYYLRTKGILESSRNGSAIVIGVKDIDETVRLIQSYQAEEKEVVINVLKE